LLAAGGVPGFSGEWSFVGKATSTSSSIDISSTGRQAGDFCVLMDVAFNSWSASASGTRSYPTHVTPSGFTNDVNEQLTMFSFTDSGSGYVYENRWRFGLSRKILSGSETPISGMTANGRAKLAYIFRCSGEFTGIAASTRTWQ